MVGKGPIKWAFSHLAGGGIKLIQPFWKAIWQYESKALKSHVL